MPEELLRLHSFVPRSRANGPGCRAVLWLQGCSLGCPGCFNPQTHSFDAGELRSTDDLLRLIQQQGDAIEGLTVSGGEPFQQLRPLTALLEKVRRETPLSVLIFTGFAWDEVERLPGVDRILPLVDVLIAGRYDETRRMADGLRGSANKTIHCLSDRYRIEDIEQVPVAEVVLTPDGEIIFTGIDPMTMSST